MAELDLPTTSMARKAGALSPAQFDFAANWLAHWHANGGAATIEADGRLSLSIPEWRFSPSYRPASMELSSELRNSHETFCDGLHMGKARALLDLLETITDGRDAVKSYLVAGRA